MGQPNYVAVYGASDDLIELRGAITEEWPYDSYSSDPGPLEGDLIAFSDGTVLRIRHEGPWRIVPVAKGSAELHIEQTTDDEGTDVATLTGDIRWAVHGTEIEKARDTT